MLKTRQLATTEHSVNMHSIIYLTALLPTICLSAPIGDLVQNLPGFGAPLAPLYSGYLSAGDGQQLHYVYSAPINANA